MKKWHPVKNGAVQKWLSVQNWCSVQKWRRAKATFAILTPTQGDTKKTFITEIWITSKVSFILLQNLTYISNMLCFKKLKHFKPILFDLLELKKCAARNELLDAASTLESCGQNSLFPSCIPPLGPILLFLWFLFYSHEYFRGCGHRTGPLDIPRDKNLGV